jgi:hypothetical protein
MIKTLRNLAEACEGDNRPHRPILEELEAGKPHGPSAKQGKGATRSRRSAASASRLFTRPLT